MPESITKSPDFGAFNIKCKLMLTEDQKTLANMYFGHCRFVYNEALEYNKALYEATGLSDGYNSLAKRLPELKKVHSFLQDVDATVLQQSLKDYDNARKRFLQHKGGYPKFRSKDNKQSFRIVNIKNNNSKNSVRFDGNKIKLGKFGWVRTKPNQPVPECDIQFATVKRLKSGKYELVLTVRRKTPTEKFSLMGAEVGIDLGLHSFATLSDGIKIPMLDLSKENEQIKKLNRQLSRKQHGSANRHKIKLQLARAYEKKSNKIRDFLHKLSLQIIKNYDFIATESLNVKSMMMKNFAEFSKINNDFHRKIADCNWSSFLMMLKYKSEWYGRKFVQIDTYFPSSQLCSSCHNTNPLTKDLSIRKWQCPVCGANHDRYINAAINVLNQAKLIA